MGSVIHRSGSGYRSQTGCSALEVGERPLCAPTDLPDSSLPLKTAGMTACSRTEMKELHAYAFHAC